MSGDSPFSFYSIEIPLLFFNFHHIVRDINSYLSDIEYLCCILTYILTYTAVKYPCTNSNNEMSHSSSKQMLYFCNNIYRLLSVIR